MKAAADVPEVPGLVRGVDYFADYDIRSVQIPPDPVGTPEKPLKFQYMNTSTAPYPFYWISSKPRVAYIPNFMTDEECDAVVKRASPIVQRSQVAVRLNEKNKNPVDEARTSSQTWMDVTSYPVQSIADKIFKQTGFAHGTSEPMQILRYELTQKYDAHQDYFDPSLYGPQSDNRAVTVFLYFTSVEEGGETWFPGADNKPVLTQEYKSCKGGFGFKPRKRDAIIFYDMTPTGGYEPYSLHGGCPVKKGIKWGGTLWLRVGTK
jgi:prolyl 4-hydroxylase